jgi:hypothetical protein
MAEPYKVAHISDIPAPTGRDPAEATGTTVLAFGGTPEEAFAVSPWEQRYTGARVAR